MRTLGGIVSESVAKMPGTSSADTPVITTCIATANHSVGASANPIHAPAITTPSSESMRRPMPGSRNINRDASGMPRVMPTNCAGSANAVTRPRCASPRWNTFS